MILLNWLNERGRHERPEYHQTRSRGQGYPSQDTPEVRQRVVETALGHLEKSPREPAWYRTDTQGRYISESSVYCILKANDLITGPAYTVLSAKDKFD